MTMESEVIMTECPKCGDEIRALESALATEKARSRTLEDVLRRAAEDETGLMSRTICRAVLGGNPTWNPK